MSIINRKFGICLVLLLIWLYGCVFKPKLTEWAKNYLYIDETYVYDPDTILKTIADGEANQQTFRVFSSSIDGSSSPVYRYWKQEDYLNLSNTFLDWYLDDSLGDWHLLELTFDSTCEEIRSYSGNPFSPLNWLQASTSYYKAGVDSENGVPFRLVNKLMISPNYGTLFISEWLYNPDPFVPNVVIPDIGSLDSMKMIIKADDAFWIAETAGGNQIEHCDIFARNSIDDEYDGWLVHYLIEKGVSFTLVVNDQTGEYKILSD